MRKGRGRLIGLSEDGSGQTVSQRVAAHIRNLVESGSIQPGARLPAQRILADDLRVSRNTVTAALGQLVSEGVLETRVGSGTYVSNDAARRAQPRWGKGKSAPAQPRFLPLDVGIPDVEMFPLEAWRRVQAQVWKRLPRAALQEGYAAGWPKLREAIASRLGGLRGVACKPDQIIVTASAQAAVRLAAGVLAAPGEIAWTEDPGYWRAREAMKAAGADVRPVSVDADGFDVATARRVGRARLAYVTPGAQFPTGVLMSAARRKALLAWSRAEDGWIIEDEFESDFWFDKRPPPPLAADSQANRVVYIGTFNNLLFPALRIAYLVAPEAALDRFHSTGDPALRATSVPMQAVLQAFMEQGHLAAHVRRCREVFGERRSVLQASLEEHFGDRWRITAPPLGLMLQAWLEEGADDDAIATKAMQAGVSVSAMSRHALLPCKPALFLGFAAHSPASIRKAVRTLAGVL